jgi:hypothetical protein
MAVGMHRAVVMGVAELLMSELEEQIWRTESSLPVAEVETVTIHMLAVQVVELPAAQEGMQ